MKNIFNIKKSIIEKKQKQLPNPKLCALLKIVSTLILFTGLLIISCGKTSVSIDSSTYEPKIMISGLLYPEHPVSNIKITRNFPVGKEIDIQSMDLVTAKVTITDMQSGEVFILTYNPVKFSFEYPGANLQIMYGGSYRLDVSADFDSYHLTASAVTTAPDKGMKILADSSVYGQLYYRQKDANGNLISPTIAFLKSDNTAFYLASVSAEEANTENFIYENPPGMDINKALKKGAKIEDFQFRSAWDRRYNSGNDLVKMEIDWFNFWFYSRYRIILYATDENYYHFFLTHEFVQEIDGNLHEPIFDIEGDGIGYFGSAITDTLYLEVLKK